MFSQNVLDTFDELVKNEACLKCFTPFVREH